MKYPKVAVEYNKYKDALDHASLELVVLCNMRYTVKNGGCIWGFAGRNSDQCMDSLKGRAPQGCWHEPK